MGALSAFGLKVILALAFIGAMSAIIGYEFTPIFRDVVGAVFELFDFILLKLLDFVAVEFESITQAEKKYILYLMSMVAIPYWGAFFGSAVSLTHYEEEEKGETIFYPFMYQTRVAMAIWIFFLLHVFVFFVAEWWSTTIILIFICAFALLSLLIWLSVIHLSHKEIIIQGLEASSNSENDLEKDNIIAATRVKIMWKKLGENLVLSLSLIGLDYIIKYTIFL